MFGMFAQYTSDTALLCVVRLPGSSAGRGLWTQSFKGAWRKNGCYKRSWLPGKHSYNNRRCFPAKVWLEERRTVTHEWLRRCWKVVRQ
jgi:hypothetical protein